MLNVFPELLFLAPFAALILRVTLAALFGYSAFTRLRSEQTLLKTLGAIDALITIALFFGIYTQLAAIAALLCTAYWLFKSDVRPLPKSTVALALVIAFSLIITGAGPFAFDLPL